MARTKTNPGARGRSGVEAFNAAKQSLGIYRDQESAALAVYAALDDGDAA